MENKDSAFKTEECYVLAVKDFNGREDKKINLVKEKWTRSDSDKYYLTLRLLHQK